MATFNATFQQSQEIKVSFSQSESLNASFENVIKKYPEDADMTARDLRFGKKGYGKDGEVIGTLPDNGDVSAEINYSPQPINIPSGITTGGVVRISPAEQAKIIVSNIKAGVTILGVTGKSTVVDVSGTTATKADVASGREFYLADGRPAVGSYLWNWMGDSWELIDDNIYESDVLLKDSPYASWTPSATALTLEAAQSLAARAINLADYEYLIRWRFESWFEYLSGVTMKAVPIRQAMELVQVLMKRPSNLTNLESGTFNGNACLTMLSAPIYDYYNTSGAHTLAFTASYGVYAAVTAATFSNSTSDTPNVTIKTPSVSAKCNSSYFATARGAYVDQDNSGYRLKGMLYRTSVGGSTRKIYEDAVDLYNNLLT